MLVGNPVRGTIKPDARFYGDHPLAVFRPPHSRIPLVTQDFGPSTVKEEPTVDWPGGESDIFGTPIVAKTYPNFHRGLDISTGGCTDDIVAAASGTVTVSRKDATGAETIVIDHGVIGGHRYETGYIHLERRLASVNAQVSAGGLIGKLGDTGKFSTACHLNFFVRKDGRFVDPWRRLLQNTGLDPDAPGPIAPSATAPSTTALAAVAPPTEDPDVPIPASNDEYLAGQLAVVGNTALGAHVRTAPRVGADIVRTIAGGSTETWLPTCWVVGDVAFASDRWLTRWHEGRWEFTHQANVASVTSLQPDP